MCLSKLQIDNDRFNIDLLSLSLSHSDHLLSRIFFFFRTSTRSFALARFSHSAFHSRNLVFFFLGIISRIRFKVYSDLP